MACRILESNGNADFPVFVNASLLELGNNGAFNFILVITPCVSLSGIVI
jgi:hypothetical protein